MSLVYRAVCPCCDWSKWLLWFWFFDSHLKTALLSWWSLSLPFISLFLGKRVVQDYTFCTFFFLFLSFFSAENTKKRRLDQNTVRWWSMVNTSVVFSPFQVTWARRSLQSNSLNFRCWYVRVLFEGIISPMCCVTYKDGYVVETLIAMTRNILKDRKARLERYLLSRFKEELCSCTPGPSCSKDRYIKL